MHAVAYDPSRLYLVQLHSGDCLSSADVENVVRSMDLLRRDADAERRALTWSPRA